MGPILIRKVKKLTKLRQEFFQTFFSVWRHQKTGTGGNALMHHMFLTATVNHVLIESEFTYLNNWYMKQAGAELSQAQLNWRLALLEWWLGSESDKILLKYIF